MDYLFKYGILVLAISALLLGGVGGSELLTNTMNITMVIVDKIDNTQCIVGISLELGTNNGVIALPTIVPSGGENANITVTNFCWPPENQHWLT